MAGSRADAPGVPRPHTVGGLSLLRPVREVPVAAGPCARAPARCPAERPAAQSGGVRPPLRPPVRRSLAATRCGVPGGHDRGPASRPANPAAVSTGHNGRLHSCVPLLPLSTSRSRRSVRRFRYAGCLCCRDQACNLYRGGGRSCQFATASCGGPVRWRGLHMVKSRLRVGESQLTHAARCPAAPQS